MTAARIARRRRQRRTRNVDGRPGRGNGNNGRRRLLIAAGVATLLLTVALASAGGTTIYGVNRYDEIAAAVVPPEKLLAELPRGGARIYDRHGTLLYEFVDELSGLRRPVPLAKISPWLVQATIATEDQDFYANNGLNVRG